MEKWQRQETETLARSWERHDPVWLRDYLVAGVEDPRINLQSIFTRHFLSWQLAGDRFAPLMEHEYGFSAALNWLLGFAGRAGSETELAEVLHALRAGSDNAEGEPLPRFLLPLSAALPARVGDLVVPNYLERFLAGTRYEAGQPHPCLEVLDTFLVLWQAALADCDPGNTRLSVLEPACGSANDYRFLARFGLASLVDYTGFDLCEANVANARALFPSARFQQGNVFEIAAPDRSFDLCFVHDLFEHLSPAGLEAAARELCRVTRRALCLNFFQMEHAPAHVVRPLDDYYLNTLSLDRTLELFARFGFTGEAFHIASFLRQKTGCDLTHNPSAWTLVLHARA